MQYTILCCITEYATHTQHYTLHHTPPTLHTYYIVHYTLYIHALRVAHAPQKIQQWQLTTEHAIACFLYFGAILSQFFVFTATTCCGDAREGGDSSTDPAARRGGCAIQSTTHGGVNQGTTVANTVYTARGGSTSAEDRGGAHGGHGGSSGAK